MTLVSDLTQVEPEGTFRLDVDCAASDAVRLTAGGGCAARMDALARRAPELGSDGGRSEFVRRIRAR